MKQTEVQIMGQSYLLGTTDNGDQKLLAAVEKVDAAMCKIRDSGKIKARDRIAVLAALNLAFELADRTAPGATRAPGEPIDQAQINSLIERLDTALSLDGRLL